MPKRTFISHVTSLRGLAILLVVWFHFTQHNNVLPKWITLPMGFYGVDVFFVIMGYFLIAGYIRKSDLSFLEFAKSKFIRIVVPMAVMIVLAILLGMIVLDWQELRALIKTALSAFCGVSNYELMYSTTGYFAASTAMNPLMHTWYLSVSLQVFLGSYIIYAILRKGSKRCVVWSLGGIASFSLGYALFGSPSYYATPSRLWEIAAGGLVVLLPEIQSVKKSALAAFIGVAMILIPSLMHVALPASVSVIVVMGTVLVIKYGAATKIPPFSNLLNNKILFFLGKISFSLYLVHMPILVLVKGLMFDPLGWLMVVQVWFVCLIIAVLFYMAVEKRKFKLWLGCVFVVVSMAFSASCFFFDVRRIHSDSLEPQYNQWHSCQYEALARNLDSGLIKPHHSWYFLSVGSGLIKTLEPPLLQLGDATKKPHFVLIGDSHAAAAWMGIDSLCREEHLSGVYLTSIMIPLWNRYLDAGGGYDNNREKMEAFMKWMISHPEIRTVIIANLWNRLEYHDMDWDKNRVERSIEKNVEAFREFCVCLKNVGKEIIVIGPLPMFGTNRIGGYARSLKSGRVHEKLVCSNEQFYKLYGKFLSCSAKMEEDGLCKFVYPHRAFQTINGYSAVLNGKPMFMDSHHLSVHGSLLQMRVLKGEMCELLK